MKPRTLLIIMITCLLLMGSFFAAAVPLLTVSPWLNITQHELDKQIVQWTDLESAACINAGGQWQQYGRSLGCTVQYEHPVHQNLVNPVPNPNYGKASLLGMFLLFLAMFVGAIATATFLFRISPPLISGRLRRKYPY
jgi:hypothetical protein